MGEHGFRHQARCAGVGAAIARDTRLTKAAAGGARAAADAAAAVAAAAVAGEAAADAAKP